jgi:hypothetical protein
MKKTMDKFLIKAKPAKADIFIKATNTKVPLNLKCCSNL